MATLSVSYSASSTTAITLANLSNAAARTSLKIDNTGTKYVDAIMQVKVTNATTTGTDNAVYIYGYGSVDGTTFATPSSGTDAAVVTTPTNLPLLGIISYSNPPFSDTPLTVHISSVANVFGGILPPYWGIAIDNRTGASLVNTAANHSVTFQGITYTSA